MQKVCSDGGPRHLTTSQADLICDQHGEPLDFNQSRSSIDSLMVLTQILLLKKNLYCWKKYDSKPLQIWIYFPYDTMGMDLIHFENVVLNSMSLPPLWVSLKTESVS